MSEKPIIVEGVAGTWFYHLAPEGHPERSYCDQRTMRTQIPLIAWGTRTHLNERYCPECAERLPKGTP